jgi:alpha-N-acetylglucosaminidase
MMLKAIALLCTLLSWQLAVASPNDPAQVAEDLVERVLPGARGHFSFKVVDSCSGSVKAPCYDLSDNGDRVMIAATSISEMTAGIGYYLRNIGNMTIGWPRGGGNNLFLPKQWPKVGEAIAKRRNVPWSYFMNVCTHSYSLVWYGWAEWQQIIDWMALSGINNVLALTGQEEVQYKVLTSFGLSDEEIRGWFNGPALLTWSRGQNEYGAGICGPLPRSWMKNQWLLNKQILARYRELGIVGQLPAFQGNVPIGLKTIKKDSNITQQGATGWIDDMDPLFGEIADKWMQVMTEDFGTDHWYQLDGYFNGGTAPWLQSDADQRRQSTTQGDYPVDQQWYTRGSKAYESLNRTDPDAIWAFQGFAVEGWKDDPKHASWLKGFVEAAPAGKFSVVDMDYTYGEWTKWNNSAFFGANFIWSALHNFGGTDGIKGNLSRVNDMPFAAQEAGKNIWGTGFTAEGIDQNPAYYEQLIEQPWREKRMSDIPETLVDRAHHRYGLTSLVPDVASAWRLLAESMYSQDVGVQDGTGVAHIPGSLRGDWTQRRIPSDQMCKTFKAWSALSAASAHVAADREPFRYDLVNTGRDVLARLSTPLSQNFQDAVEPSAGHAPDAKNVQETGSMYLDLLKDLDTLVGTDKAFLLGSWITMARRFGENASDCNAKGMTVIHSCEDFYEWNARVQITSWNPTLKGAAKVPSGPIDYAAKHWNGLIGGYYHERALRLQKMAIKAAKQHKPLQTHSVDRMKAEIAYEFQTDFATKYPEVPVGDAVQVSKQMLQKYSHFFSSCGTSSPLSETAFV